MGGASREAQLAATRRKREEVARQRHVGAGINTVDGHALGLAVDAHRRLGGKGYGLRIAMTSRTTITVTTTDPRSSSASREPRENAPPVTTMGSSQSSADGKAFVKQLVKWASASSFTIESAQLISPPAPSGARAR